MTRRIYWGLAMLAIMIVGFVAFQLYRHIDLTNRLEIADETKTETPTTPEETPEVVDVSEREEKPLDYGPEKPAGSASRGADTASRTEYATEPVYDISERGHEYMRYIPRDPSRFAHLPAPPLPPSAVPEDCPEHLILPSEWIDGVYRGLEPPPANDHANDQFTGEIAERLRDIVLEIIREHNPKRPYVEIWDQFIEYEKMYRAYAEWELGYTPVASLSASRLDWWYEQVWAFPEFIDLLIAEGNRPHGEENRFSMAVDVAMGYMTPDWNKITLKDGRDFFIKGNSRYEFSYSGVSEDGTEEWRNVTGFSRVRLTDSTPVVHIDVPNTSDAALEAMMGWDYRINPITMRPLVHDSSYVTLYPRFIEED